MPAGLANNAEKDPRNYSTAEARQAKRADADPAAIKQALQDAWSASDSAKAFVHAVAEQGLALARGDRRSFVVVDPNGEVFALARWLGVRTKAVEAKLAGLSELPTVEQAKADLTDQILTTVSSAVEQDDFGRRADIECIEAERLLMVQAHRALREALRALQGKRATAEAVERARRIRRGLLGLWDRITGRQAKIIADNEADGWACAVRDRVERQTLVASQLRTRRALQRRITEVTLPRLRPNALALNRRPQAFLALCR